MSILKTYWYLILIGLFFVFAVGVFAFFGEGSFIAIHDNLDLFIPQYRMMKETGTYLSRGAEAPFLGGISRDNLPAEFSLTTVLYMILPDFPAYVAGYILKIIIAVLSCYLLARDFLGEKHLTYRPIIFLTGFSYGILNMFPNFGIAFASIPLAVFLLRRIYYSESVKKAGKWYLALFFYPLLSYFSYFGLFLLGYLAVAVIWLSVKNKKICVPLLIGLGVLAAGYIGCEYRLFGQMLFGSGQTIRSTMEIGAFSFGGILRETVTVLSRGMFHAESAHTWLVLPVCGIYFLILNICYLKSANAHSWRVIFHDPYNLLLLLIVFNSVIYGLYFGESFRNAVEALLPPLKGWQFNRTVFFNPFLWYAAFFLVLKRMYDANRKVFANLLALAAIAVILLSGTRYNDLYHTCYYKTVELARGKAVEQLNYREFYSADLFEAAKEALNYKGEWSAAYGFYPAVIEYSGIASLDGYLGYYSQEYKAAFRKVIEPALTLVPESRAYYDGWGARVNLYSGNYPTVISPVKTPPVTEDELFFNKEAFRELGGRYIFSRVRITNPEEAGVRLALEMKGEDYGSPYMLYVYDCH